jgi:hypothetical protein
MAIATIIQDVSQVEWATKPLDEISTKEAIERMVGGNVESCSDYFGKVAVDRTTEQWLARVAPWARPIGVVHPMVGAIHQAYQEHRPLVLSPDMFWLLVTQGLALHVNNHPDEFPGRFRVGGGQQEILIRNDEMHKGSPENPWEEVLDHFCCQIEARIGMDNYSHIVTSFSTTGRVERAANAIVLMECLKCFFQFGLESRCGIPQVLLEGSPQDWGRLRDKTESLGEAFGLTWWTYRLVPILDRIARNVAGKDDPSLWETLYKQVGGSGGPCRGAGSPSRLSLSTACLRRFTHILHHRRNSSRC